MVLARALILLVAACAASALAASSATPVKATGWFADEGCALSKAKAGNFTPTNAECSKRCLKDGAKLVFVAEQQKSVWIVQNPDSFRDRIGFYVSVDGTLDSKGRSIEIGSAKTLKAIDPSCSLPSRKK